MPSDFAYVFSNFENVWGRGADPVSLVIKYIISESILLTNRGAQYFPIDK